MSYLLEDPKNYSFSGWGYKDYVINWHPSKCMDPFPTLHHPNSFGSKRFWGAECLLRHHKYIGKPPSVYIYTYTRKWFHRQDVAVTNGPHVYGACKDAHDCTLTEVTPLFHSAPGIWWYKRVHFIRRSSSPLSHQHHGFHLVHTSHPGAPMQYHPVPFWKPVECARRSKGLDWREHWCFPDIISVERSIPSVRCWSARCVQL